MSSPFLEATYAPPRLNIRGVDITADDLSELEPILFAEISNRTPDKQFLEGRTIINTALNRFPLLNSRGRATTLRDVLTQPNAYQGYDPQGISNKQYNLYRSGQLTELDQQKVGVVKKLTQELLSGKFEDTTGGRVFYTHDKQGRIWLDDRKLYR